MRIPSGNSFGPAVEYGVIGSVVANPKGRIVPGHEAFSGQIITPNGHVRYTQLCQKLFFYTEGELTIEMGSQRPANEGDLVIFDRDEKNERVVQRWCPASIYLKAWLPFIASRVEGAPEALQVHRQVFLLFPALQSRLGEDMFSLEIRPFPGWQGLCGRRTDDDTSDFFAIYAKKDPDYPQIHKFRPYLPDDRAPSSQALVGQINEGQFHPKYIRYLVKVDHIRCQIEVYPR